MTLPGCTPGPLQAWPSITVAASQAARSSALRAERASAPAASRTPRVSSRATAARRNSRASEVIVIAAGAISSATCPGAMSTCAQRVPAAGMDHPNVVISPSRDPITSIASASSSRARTVVGDPKPAMPRYSGWSFEMTSPRRQVAITGTRRSSASRIRSFEVRARRTPASTSVRRNVRAEGRSGAVLGVFTVRRVRMRCCHWLRTGSTVSNCASSVSPRLSPPSAAA